MDSLRCNCQKLGFTYAEIINAYIAKNEENYDRQKTGY